MAPRTKRDLEMNNWGNEACDPESLDRLYRGSSWFRSRTLYGDRSSTGFGSASIRSIRSTVSHWSIAWVAQWSLGSKRTEASAGLTGYKLSEPHELFIVALLGERPQLDLQPACGWYIGFLESKIEDSWSTLFSPVLTKADDHSKSPVVRDPSVAFQILQTIVFEITKENLALTDIVDKLYNNKTLKYGDHERSHANQLVLAALGWISCLYPARLDPEPRKLQIISPWEGTSDLERRQAVRRVRRRKVKTFTEYEQTFAIIDQPLHSLLSKFGNIVPKRHRQLSFGHVTPMALPMGSVRPSEEWIELTLLCFHTLNKVALIKIEWVDSLSLHLDFDGYTKVLKIFRLPSICLLMSCGKKMSPLSQLFFDSEGSQGYELEDASEFYREVLLTYRLIFGQKKSSWEDFNTITRTSSPVPEKSRDPLLSVLCGENWESKEARPLYEMIGAEDPSTHYEPHTEFPFFAERLLDIQKYVRGHNPGNFWALWCDTRNPLQWWTFWAVFIIGGITLILTLLLGILQAVVGILQVIYTKG